MSYFDDNEERFVFGSYNVPRHNYKRNVKRERMSKDTIIVVRGKVSWAKVTGAARPHTGNPKYDKGPYWSIDVIPDEKSRAVIKAAKISNKLREPSGNDIRKETFLTLKVLKNKADGTPNLDNNGNQIVPKISTVTGQKWDGSNIGNDSVCDIKIKVKDYDGTVGVYFQEMRVLKHIPYEGGGFEPLSEDDEFFASGEKEVSGNVGPNTDKTSPNLDDVDDEIPF